MAYAGIRRHYKQAEIQRKATNIIKKDASIAEYRTVTKEADLYLSAKIKKLPNPMTITI